MSKVIVDLELGEDAEPAVPFSDYKATGNRGRGRRVLGIFTGIVILVLVAAGVAGFLYWRHLKTTPQYSLALLVDAARRDDQRAIDQLVDTDAVVEDFVPQITDKAVELYGRGLAPGVIKRVASIAAPVMPVVKERARAELPKILRDRTKRFENIPFYVMAAGADRYLNIRVDGDRAKISSKQKNRPLELTLKKNGDRWQIVGLKDEQLARKIAERVGQQIIALVKQRGADAIDRAGKKIGVENLGDILKKAEDIFK